MFPGPDTAGTPVLLCTTVLMDDRPGDWTELELDVCWTTSQGELEVSAQLGVACFCEEDHNTHYVESLSLVVDGERSLAEAFEQAVEHVVS